MNCSSMKFQVSEELDEEISIAFQCFPYLDSVDIVDFPGGI